MKRWLLWSLMALCAIGLYLTYMPGFPD